MWFSARPVLVMALAALLSGQGLAQTPPHTDDQSERAQERRKPDGTANRGKATPRTEAPPQRRREGERTRAEPRRPAPQPPRPPRPIPRRPTPGSVIFIGGYFYDPAFGPRPWWPTTIYPHVWPVFIDARAHVRVDVRPRQAAVYVDGFYAGIADDFDGFFQALPLLPGGHVLTLYLPGYATITRRLYLSPRSTMRLRETLVPLSPGIVSEPPEMAPALPPPPPGSYGEPHTPPTDQPPSPSAAVYPVAGLGTLALRVQPPSAQVRIDGQLWESATPGTLTLQLPAGTHRIEITGPNGQLYQADAVIVEGETAEVNVSVIDRR